MAVIDADGHVMGRLSSKVAERILKGEEIIIVNAERAIITGKREMVFAEYKQKKDRGKIMRGPFYPRRADLILKKSVKGMIPFKTPSGREAYKRLKVYVGIPKEYSSAKLEKVEVAIRPRTDKYVRLGDVSGYLGSKVR
ncbi:MAG: 50S ribosomal protein L13 [Methanomassiliicoccales archaeon]|jgi:large subunit ribosomal protein L13|nr:50S ribosomal protein L13 [Methanomassiliicoccales archaeon]